MGPMNGTVTASKSGIGLPHSTTSRKEWGAMLRASVVECGSLMPLSSVRWQAEFIQTVRLVTSAATNYCERAR